VKDEKILSLAEGLLTFTLGAPGRRVSGLTIMNNVRLWWYLSWCQGKGLTCTAQFPTI